MSVLFSKIVQYVKRHPKEMRIFLEEEKVLVYKALARGRMQVVQAQERAVLVNKVSFASWEDWFAYFGLISFDRLYRLAQNHAWGLVVRHYDAEKKVMECIISNWEGRPTCVRVQESPQGYLLDRSGLRHKTFFSWKESMNT